MTVINPIASTLINTSGVRDESHQVWNKTKTYTHGDYVIHDNSIYRKNQAGNTDKNPNDYIKDPLETTKHWVDYGKINHLRALDDKNSSKTTGVNISYTLDIGNCDTIAFFNLDKVLDIKVELQIKRNNSYTTIETYDIKPIAYDVDNILEYIDNQTTYKPEIHQSFPVYFEDKRVVLTIKNGDNEVGIGNIVVGKSIFIDDTEAKITGSILDFSKTKTSEAGFTTIKQGISLRLIDINIITNNIIRVQERLRALVGKSIAVIGVESSDFATIFGFLKKIKPSITNARAEFSVEIQEIA